MRVVLAPGIFGKANVVELTAIIHFGWSGRHRIIPDDLNEADAWVAGQQQQLREELTLALEESLRLDGPAPDGGEVRVTANPTSNWGSAPPELSIQDAIDVLTEPLRLWVENADADRAFLLFAVGTELAKTIEEREKRGWVAFAMGGGSTMEAQIDALKAPHAAARRLRSWAMYDSDRLSANDHDPKAHQLDQTCATRLKDRRWPLARRNIESYLPRRVFHSWVSEVPHPDQQAQRRARVEALDALGEHRDWFNHKHGFRGDKEHDRRAAQDAWAQLLPEDVRARLDEGFGKDVARLFEPPTIRGRDRDPRLVAEAAPHVDRLRALL